MFTPKYGSRKQCMKAETSVIHTTNGGNAA
jgi:hypothetical protein